jgi:hypothetical protein
MMLTFVGGYYLGKLKAEAFKNVEYEYEIKHHRHIIVHLLEGGPDAPEQWVEGLRENQFKDDIANYRKLKEEAFER